MSKPLKLVDHDYLEPGMYCVRKEKTKGLFAKPIYVYDCRFRKPNSNNYLLIKQAHTLEHLIAWYIKELYPGQVISWNMFMCLTGGYLETYMEPAKAKEALLETINYILTSARDEEIPFATKKLCGNYKSHDKEAALQELEAYARILEDQDVVLYYDELKQIED